MLALALPLLCAASRSEAANNTQVAAPPPPGPPGAFSFGMSVCETEVCRLHSAVLALASVLALSGFLNLILGVYIGYKARMCRSWCAF